MSGIGAHALAPGPAALAALPAERGGGDDLEDEPGNVLALVAGPALRGRGGAEAHGRDVEEGGEEAVTLGLEERPPLLLRGGDEEDHRVHRLADASLLARALQGAGDLAADLEEALPLPAQPLVDPLAALLGKGDQVHALGLAAARDMRPHLFGGEGQDGGQESRKG